MRFTKMQGCGNDYIYINCFEEQVDDPSSLAVRLSDRHYGIGGDGLILIEPSARADAYMHMFNLDGSEGSMCGNGIRCVAKYIYDNGIIPEDRRHAVIDTKAGLREVSFDVEDGCVTSVTVDMGKPKLVSVGPESLNLCGAELIFTAVDIGNPHAVFFLEDNPQLGDTFCDSNDLIAASYERSLLQFIDIKKIGDILARERFPDGVNSEFISISSRGEIFFRVWERGSGETLACGTGAAALVFAGIMADKIDDEVLVHLAGGDLLIRYDRATGKCFMTGPAEDVFTGYIGV